MASSRFRHIELSHLLCVKVQNTLLNLVREGRKIVARDFEKLPQKQHSNIISITKTTWLFIVCGSLEKLPEAFAKIDFERNQRIVENKPQTDFASIVHLPLTESELPSADGRLTQQNKRDNVV